MKQENEKNEGYLILNKRKFHWNVKFQMNFK